MKATGVIRRIDELGRVVIPKEIRKNLRIREGDSLEIYIDNNDSIVLKKYSALNGLKELSSVLAESIYNDIKKNVLITDTDKVLAAAGKDKKEYLGKELSESVIFSMQRREQKLESHTKEFSICGKEENMTYTIATIIVNGDVFGSVLIFDKEGAVGEMEQTIASVMANFLAKHIDG